VNRRASHDARTCIPTGAGGHSRQRSLSVWTKLDRLGHRQPDNRVREEAGLSHDDLARVRLARSRRTRSRRARSLALVSAKRGCRGRGRSGCFCRMNAGARAMPSCPALGLGERGWWVAGRRARCVAFGGCSSAGRMPARGCVGSMRARCARAPIPRRGVRMNRSALPFQRGVRGGMRMWRAPSCCRAALKCRLRR
jgi:hypothetical protein